MEHQVLLKKIEFVTHNVLHLVTEKPEGYTFLPGQATELAIDKEGLREEKRPFTFTSLPEDGELEFTIKVYPSHDGVTKQWLIIGDSWGAIEYKGKGSFIAGGAGITPFIAILKDLHRNQRLEGHQLFFGNQTEKDIIYKGLLESWLGDNFYNILSDEDKEGYPHGHIDKNVLAQHDLDVTKHVYLCGPPPMMDALQADLYAMGLSKKLLVAEGLD